MKICHPQAVTESVTPMGVTRTDYTGKWHARITPSMISDKRLSDREFRVLAGLCLWQKRGRIDIGLRALSEACAVPHQKLTNILRRLEQFVHIAQKENGPKRRRTYELVAEFYSNGIPVCAKCGKPRRLNKAAFCRACTIDIDAKHGIVSRPLRTSGKRMTV